MDSTGGKHTMTATENTYYKLDIQGIVYLVDATTAAVYTYDLQTPTEIGRLVWTDPKAAPQIALLSNWQELLTAKQNLDTSC